MGGWPPVQVLMIGGQAEPGFFGDGNAPCFLARELDRRCDLRQLPLVPEYVGAAPPPRPFVASRRPRPADAVRALRALPRALADVHRHVWRRRTRSLGLYLADAALARRELRRDPDIVHLQSDEWKALPALHSTIRRGLPFVVTVHLPYGLDTSVNRDFHHDLEADFLHEAQEAGGHVVCVSEQNRRRLVEAFDLDADRMHVIRNGCDVPDRLPGPRAARPTLLQVGSLNKRKNHRVVLDAMAALGDGADFDYWIAGGGGKEGPLRARVRELGLEDRVRFWGRVERDELADLYARAHALVLPSLSEGFALVMLEALAAGLPIVAFEDLDGVRELGHPEVTVTAPRDGLGDAIVDALGHDWDRAAIQDVAREFSWSEAARRHVRLYERVLAE